MKLIFETDAELIKHLRDWGDESYNEAPDDFIFEEAFTQGWVEMFEGKYIMSIPNANKMFDFKRKDTKPMIECKKRRFIFPMKTCYEIRIDANNIEDAMKKLKERVESKDILVPEYAQCDGVLDTKDLSHLTKNKFDCIDISGEHGLHITSFESDECMCGEWGGVEPDHCGCVGDEINGLYHVKLDGGWEEC